MKKLPKTIISIGLILWVAIVVLWVMVFHQPQRGRVSILEKQVQKIGERIRIAIVPETALQRLETEVDTLKNDIDKIEKKIYPLKQMQHIGRELIRYARGYHLRMISITPNYEVLFPLQEVKPQGQPMIKLPVTFLMRGRYKNFGKFADNIHTLPFAFAIDEIRLEADPVIYPDLNIQMKGFLYLLTEEKTTVSTTKTTM